MLHGVSMRVLKEGLDRAGVPWEVRKVPLAEVGRFPFAFASNSISPVRAIVNVDSVTFAPDPAVVRMLESAYASVPPEPLV